MSDDDDGPVLGEAAELNESGPDDDDDVGITKMPMSEAMSFNGYGNSAPFGSPFANVPAPPPVALQSGNVPEMTYGNIANLGKEDCRQALLEFAASNCCYGKGTAKDHEINAVKPFTSFHYVLETYSEGRKTGNKHVPFKGQYIDGPQNGSAPLPWDIPCEADQHFLNHIKLIEVPHTAYVKQCHCCHGDGRVTCKKCSGRGKVRCARCGGRGRRRVYNSKQKKHVSRSCISCGGRGRRRCSRCSGSGRVICKVCDGSGQLKCYIELAVTFTNHKEDHIYEPTDMPDELIKGAQGEVIFEQTLFQVWPVKDFPVPDIAQNSLRMVEKHRTSWPYERQLQQRQHIRSVPVTEVDAVWKDWSSRYWVYGFDRQVYCSDYPQTCCWGCTIL